MVSPPVVTSECVSSCIGGTLERKSKGNPEGSLRSFSEGDPVETMEQGR